MKSELEKEVGKFFALSEEIHEVYGAHPATLSFLAKKIECKGLFPQVR
jgi:hypothetical protein